MKKKIFSAAVFALIMITNTFATNTDGNVDRRVLMAFSQKFASAIEVSWIKSENYSRASFTWNHQVMSAYFSEAGDFLGTTRNLLSYQLPINLQKELKKEYKDRWITELYEFADEEESVYYATVENTEEKVILKSVGTSSWEVYKKVKKN